MLIEGSKAHHHHHLTV